MFKIIYPNNNTISIIEPNYLLDINYIAKKDVPKGLPYKIVDSTYISEDRTFRDAWQLDFSNPDGYGEGESL